jgi:tRNA(Arg) A34 adenosine deaminase TadA
MRTKAQREVKGRYLAEAWREKSVSQLMSVNVGPPCAEEQERHRIFCYLLFYLLNEHWNPYKYGLLGEYPWVNRTDAVRTSYVGHNIAAIAVSSNGRVIDFDFNHNELFNSSAEHAEARLLRRLFALGHQFAKDEDRLYIDASLHAHRENRKAGLADALRTRSLEKHFIHSMANYTRVLSDAYDPENTMARTQFGRALTRITVYTTLESCAQCSGMMALAAVEKVIYLQPDPGQNNIGAILFNLNDVGETAFKAPLPLPASACGVIECSALSEAYLAFLKRVRSARVKPFYKEGNVKRFPSASITTFLCTSAAKEILQSAAVKFSRSVRPTRDDWLPLKFADWRPSPQSLTNREAWLEAKEFAQQVLRYGRRGTPHRI